MTNASLQDLSFVSGSPSAEQTAMLIGIALNSIALEKGGALIVVEF